MGGDDLKLKIKVVQKMARKRLFGNKKMTVDGVKNSVGVRSDQIGDVEDVIRELASEPTAPVEYYGGGARDNVRLTSAQDARDWLDDNGADTPWNL